MMRLPCWRVVDPIDIDLNHSLQSFRKDHFVLTVGECFRDLCDFGNAASCVELPRTVLTWRRTRFDDKQSAVRGSNGFFYRGQKAAADTLPLSRSVDHDHDQFPGAVGHLHRKK